MTACPDHETKLQAYVDDELDSLSAAAFEEHLRACAGCNSTLDEIHTVRAALAARVLRDPAPTALRDRIERLAGLTEAPASAPRATRSIGASIAGWIGGGTIGAIAASLAILIGAPAVTTAGLQDELIDSHIRSLQVNHLTDVLTADRHVVKPWFNGRIDFSPPVHELAKQGFPLVGGRLDYVDGRPIAALVYRRQLHTINLFVRPASATASPVAETSTRHSYNLVRWVAGGLEYWAVSDVEMRELVAFRSAFEQAQ